MAKTAGSKTHKEMEDLTNKKFEIDLDGLKLNVQEYTIERQIFRIVFPDDREPLIITNANTAKGKKWVSVPQGRQIEAEWIGAKIVDYLKNK
jgi:hypothetical protein